jgi:hypothetical protein
MDDESTPEVDEDWQQLWQIISAMRGLHDLRVWVMFNSVSDWSVTSEQEARFLRPLMALDWIRTFEVQVSWPANQGSEAILRKAPFRLVRIIRDHL